MRTDIVVITRARGAQLMCPAVLVPAERHRSNHRPRLAAEVWAGSQEWVGRLSGLTLLWWRRQQAVMLFIKAAIPQDEKFILTIILRIIEGDGNSVQTERASWPNARALSSETLAHLDVSDFNEQLRTVASNFKLKHLNSVWHINAEIWCK
jgi:hypothetical protein